MYKSGQRGEFCPQVLCSYFSSLTVVIIPCGDINDVGDIIKEEMSSSSVVKSVKSALKGSFFSLSPCCLLHMYKHNRAQRENSGELRQHPIFYVGYTGGDTGGGGQVGGRPDDVDPCVEKHKGKKKVEAVHWKGQRNIQVRGG